MESERVSKEGQRLVPAFWRTDVPAGLGLTREGLSHNPEDIPFGKLTWASHFPPGACSSYHFCFLWSMSIRIESPVWLSGRKGMRKGRWREVMQSSETACEYWTRFRTFPLSLQTLILFFPKMFTPLHQTTFLICRNLKRKYSQEYSQHTRNGEPR